MSATSIPLVHPPTSWILRSFFRVINPSRYDSHNQFNHHYHHWHFCSAPIFIFDPTHPFQVWSKSSFPNLFLAWTLQALGTILFFDSSPDKNIPRWSCRILRNYENIFRKNTLIFHKFKNFSIHNKPFVRTRSYFNYRTIINSHLYFHLLVYHYPQLRVIPYLSHRSVSTPIKSQPIITSLVCFKIPLRVSPEFKIWYY